MNARISLDAYANSTFTGTVSSVSPTPVESSSVVSYTAKILMPAIDREVYSNMSATVQIVVAEKNDVLIIPSKAIKSEKGKSYVQVIDGTNPNAASIQTEVTLGLTDDASIEVLSGLTLGQKLKIQSTTSSGTATKTSTS